MKVGDKVFGKIIGFKEIGDRTIIHVLIGDAIASLPVKESQLEIICQDEEEQQDTWKQQTMSRFERVE